MASAIVLERPAIPPALERVRGAGHVAARVQNGRTRLAELFQEGAAKIRLPHTHDASLQAVLMNTAGGLTDGDQLEWSAAAAPGSHLVLTTPACERIYRSRGGDARVETRLEAGSGARIDWLPQETILFEGARLRRSIEVDLAGDATLLAVEAVLLGRQAMGEAANAACLGDSWRIRRGGRLIHAEATRLSGDAREREGLSLLAGQNAFATLLYIGADAERRHEALRALPDHPAVGHSLLGERLVVRLLAPSGLALRRLVIPIIAVFSGGTALPRLWHL
jgi:urease accessory protein